MNLTLAFAKIQLLRDQSTSAAQTSNILERRISQLKIMAARLVFITLFIALGRCEEYIGRFEAGQHGVRGDVYVKDPRTLLVKQFSYDGRGPDTYFRYSVCNTNHGSYIR